MSTTVLVTLVVSIFNSASMQQSTRTERMPAGACERELQMTARSVGPGDVMIGQCIADSKFFSK